ncbi:MAG TPA: hypothetical protein VNT22_01735 [Baekduia sp.]|nr:hypothetical protein [Baekduia sp.]
MATPAEAIAALRALPGGRKLFEAVEPSEPVWIVGGAVRDLLLGRTPTEIDLVTTQSAMEIAGRFGKLRGKSERFGTVKAGDDGLLFDVAQTRSETYAAPGALPDVTTGVTLERDLERRDFTINAMALSLTGDLVAHPDALEDLEAGRLRVLHDRSFADDPTRLWRLVRYAVRLGFTIEPYTAELAVAAVADDALETISGKRRGTELKLALREPNPLAVLHAAMNLGLTPPLTLDPEIVGRALEIAPTGSRTDLMILGSAVENAQWLSALRFKTSEFAILLDCVGVRPAPAGPPSKVATVLRDLCDEAVALSGARGSRAAAERWLLEWRDVKLEIDGDDLIAAGITPGPEIGKRLRRTLREKLDGEVSGREAELEAALR